MPSVAGHQRLFSASLEDSLKGYAGRAIACVIAFAVACIWASILTWSANDRGLARAADGSVANLMGIPGAAISNLLLDVFGLATLVLLLAPMMWTIELLRLERLTSARSKAVFYPLSVLALAGALASLPIAASWPLEHGYGGLLGDIILNAATRVSAVVNPERAQSVAGLLLFLVAAPALARGAGLELRDVGGLVMLPVRWLASSGAGWSAHALGSGRGLLDRLAAMRAAAADHAMRPEESWRRAEPALLFRREPGIAPRLGGWPPDQTFEDQSSPPGLEADPGDDFAPLTPEEAAFEEGTDLMSRAIAERFAPAGAARPQPLPREVEPAAPPKAPAKPGLLGKIGLRKPEAALKRPPLSLLKRAPASKPGSELSQTMLRGSARLLEDVLADYGVKGEVRDIRPGPVVTLFEFEPARGTKTSRIVALADDIARSMSAKSVRVAVVPGRNTIGIELPNARREPVALRDLLESEAYAAGETTLPLALGRTIGGEPVVADLARMPHLLIAGTTGSGKSVGVNAMILSLLFRHGPDECRFLMIDPKMLELSVYNGIPHLLAPVVTDPQQAVAALNWAVAEMEERYKRMAGVAVRSVEAFNNRVVGARKRGETLSRTVHTGFDFRTGQARYEQETIDLEPLPYIVIVVDEFADLMIAAGKEIEVAVQRLAQKARAAGIHLVMATQRPSVDVITGTIKSNFPTRISFKVASKIDSRTILNEQGAEQLLGQGDMLFASGSGQMSRVHGPFVSDEEIESIAAVLRASGAPRYVEGLATASGSLGEGAPGDEQGGSHDSLYDRAVAVVLRDRKASTSYIQRRLSIGYNRAADLVERMEAEGLVSAQVGAGKREILVGDQGLVPRLVS